MIWATTLVTISTHNLPLFLKSYKTPTTQKQKLFSQYQKSAQKDVERAFGILQIRFAFVREPTKL